MVSVRRAGAFLLLLTTTLACSGPERLQAGHEDSGHGGQDAKAYVFDVLRARYETGDRGNLGQIDLSMVDYLPNTHGVEIGRPESEAELFPDSAIVVGEIIDVRPGFGFVETKFFEPEGRHQVAFDDPKASWKALYLTVQVHESFGDLPASGTFTSGVTVWNWDLERFAAGLKAIGPAVFVVDRRSPIFGYDPEVWAISGDGTYIAEIDTAGNLSLPMLPESVASGRLSTGGTLDELRKRAAGPGRLVTYELRAYGLKLFMAAIDKAG